MPGRPAAGSVETVAGGGASGGGASAASGAIGAGASAASGDGSGQAQVHSARRNEVGPHPILAVRDLIGPGLRADEEVQARSAGKLYWRFFTIGARYCTHSFDGLLGPQPRGGLHRPADEGDRVGEVVDRQRTGERTVGRLVDVAEVLERRRGDVQRLLDVVEALDQRRGDRRQLVRRGAERLAVVRDEALQVADDRVEVPDRLADLVRVVGQQTDVTDARLRFSCSSRSALSCSADTSVDRFLKVPKMSLLWSPSADNVCDSLMTVSRMVAPCPRRLSAAVLMNSPNVLTPPGLVGCSSSFSR